MSRCGTCRFWMPPSERADFGGNCVTYADDEYDETADDGWGDYKHGGAADRLFGECRAITLGESLPPGPPPLAVTQDASNYVATLYTQAEFGCAMHKPTEDPA